MKLFFILLFAGVHPNFIKIAQIVRTMQAQADAAATTDKVSGYLLDWFYPTITCFPG